LLLWRPSAAIRCCAEQLNDFGARHHVERLRQSSCSLSSTRFGLVSCSMPNRPKKKRRIVVADDDAGDDDVLAIAALCVGVALTDGSALELRGLLVALLATPSPPPAPPPRTAAAFELDVVVLLLELCAPELTVLPFSSHCWRRRLAALAASDHSSRVTRIDGEPERATPKTPVIERTSTGEPVLGTAAS
jgi:hypothetical protein